jgi:DNA-binding NarL/FixJ family response regulator
MPTEARQRLLLVDDQVLFVESLKCVLEEHATDIEVVGVAHDGNEAVAFCMTTRPDIILMDVRMPKMDGVQATRTIHELYPRIKIVMLTTFADDDYYKVAMKFGAVGYLLKNIPPDELIRSLRAIKSSITQVSHEIMERLIADEAPPPAAEAAFCESLTVREKEILQLILDAWENRQIAAHLCVSEQTVKNHIHNLYEKLGVSSRIQLIKVMGRMAGGSAR